MNQVTGSLRCTEGTTYLIRNCGGPDCHVWVKVNQTMLEEHEEGGLDLLSDVQDDPGFIGSISGRALSLLNGVGDRLDLGNPVIQGDFDLINDPFAGSSFESFESGSNELDDLKEDDADVRGFSRSILGEKPTTQQLIAQGIADKETIVRVSVKVYYTAGVEKFTSDIEGFLNDVVAETNQGYINSDVKVRVFLHCIEKYAHDMGTKDSVQILNRFRYYKRTAADIRGGADVALLVVHEADSCGRTKGNSLIEPLGFVLDSCAKGYYSFGHEIAHMFGAQHDRRVSKRSYVPYGHGFLIEGSSNSRTILA